MELWGVLGACAVIIAVIAAYYFYFDPSHIDEEEHARADIDTPGERAKAILERREKIEDDKIDQISNIVGDD